MILTKMMTMIKNKSSKPTKTSIISKSKAIAIAKKKVNGTVIEIEKDDDDGKLNMK